MGHINGCAETLWPLIENTLLYISLRRSVVAEVGQLLYNTLRLGIKSIIIAFLLSTCCIFNHIRD